MHFYKNCFSFFHEDFWWWKILIILLFLRFDPFYKMNVCPEVTKRTEQELFLFVLNFEHLISCYKDFFNN